VFCKSFLSFFLGSFGHCFVCRSSMYGFLFPFDNFDLINVWEYRMGNQKWTIQRTRKHRVHNTKKNTNMNLYINQWHFFYCSHMALWKFQYIMKHVSIALIGTIFFYSKQVLGLYRLTTQICFITLRFYLKFGLYRILVYTGFGLNRFYCILNCSN